MAAESAKLMPRGGGIPPGLGFCASAIFPEPFHRTNTAATSASHALPPSQATVGRRPSANRRFHMPANQGKPRPLPISAGILLVTSMAVIHFGFL